MLFSFFFPSPSLLLPPFSLHYSFLTNPLVSFNFFPTHLIFPPLLIPLTPHTTPQSPLRASPAFTRPAGPRRSPPLGPLPVAPSPVIPHRPPRRGDRAQQHPGPVPPAVTRGNRTQHPGPLPITGGGRGPGLVRLVPHAYDVDDSKAKLVTVPQLWDRVENLGLPAVFLDRKISEDGSLGSSNQGIFFQDLVELGAHVSEFPRVSFVQSDTAVLLYSSGTTGISKGVVLTHRNLMASACMLTAEQEINGDGPYVFVCFVPMFHVFGLVVICYSQLMKGNSVVSVERFDLEVVLRAVEKYRVTHLYAVPPVMTALSKQNWAKKYDFSSLKKIVSGAAPLGKEVMEECAKNYRNAKILQGYGHVALSHSSLLKQ